MGVLGTVLTIAGTLAQGVASYRAAQNSAAMAEAQAANEKQQYLNNAALAKSEADAVSRQGFEEDQQLRDKVRRVAAAQRAEYAAGGVSLDSGSALDVTTDTMQQGELDASLLRQNFARKRIGLENQASNYAWNARETEKLGAYKASAYRSQANMSLASSLLSTAGAVSSKWDSMIGKKSSGGSNKLKIDRTNTRNYHEGNLGGA